MKGPYTNQELTTTVALVLAQEIIIYRTNNFDTARQSPATS